MYRAVKYPNVVWESVTEDFHTIQIFCMILSYFLRSTFFFLVNRTSLVLVVHPALENNAKIIMNLIWFQFCNLPELSCGFELVRNTVNQQLTKEIALTKKKKIDFKVNNNRIHVKRN